MVKKIEPNSTPKDKKGRGELPKPYNEFLGVFLINGQNNTPTNNLMKEIEITENDKLIVQKS